MRKETQDSEIISFEEATEYVSIPRGVYMSRSHQRAGRTLHAHTCIEMTYILSGSATHEIHFPDGKTVSEPITVGNYYVLDYQIGHIIRDTSQDFFLINLLFQPSFVNAELSKTEPFDRFLKTVFRDIHLETMTGSIANRNYYDEDKEIRSVFEKAWEAYKLHSPGYRDLLRCFISEILFPTGSLQAGTSPSPLTVNRGRNQRVPLGQGFHSGIIDRAAFLIRRYHRGIYAVGCFKVHHFDSSIIRKQTVLPKKIR